MSLKPTNLNALSLRMNFNAMDFDISLNCSRFLTRCLSINHYLINLIILVKATRAHTKLNCLTFDLLIKTNIFDLLLLLGGGLFTNLRTNKAFRASVECSWLISFFMLFECSFCMLNFLILLDIIRRGKNPWSAFRRILIKINSWSLDLINRAIWDTCVSSSDALAFKLLIAVIKTLM